MVMFSYMYIFNGFCSIVTDPYNHLDNSFAT